MTGAAQMVAGIVAGFVIGVIASLLGVAGGEFLIPTLVLLFGADIKLAGSLSLAVSLPTMLVGFTRYSMDDSFSVLGETSCSCWSWLRDRWSALSSAADYWGWCLTMFSCRSWPRFFCAIKVWRHE
jgi:Sulfite exporter TauE/SafE